MSHGTWHMAHGTWHMAHGLGTAENTIQKSILAHPQHLYLLHKGLSSLAHTAPPPWRELKGQLVEEGSLFRRWCGNEWEQTRTRKVHRHAESKEDASVFVWGRDSARLSRFLGRR